MRALRIVFFVVVLVSGCLPWGDASQWSGAPAGVTSWDWILDETSIPSRPPAVDFLGLDAFDSDARYVQEAVDAGTTVWCYVSVGTAEDYRDDWAELVALDNAARANGEEPILGGDLPAWPGERWLNIQVYPVFLDVMISRLRTCAEKGFTLVEFDNMDAYTNDTGLTLTEQDTRAYIATLVGEANDRGLGVIHKNAEGLIDDLEPSMAALLLESCVLDDFCAAGAPFLEAGKPVLNAEYPARWAEAGRRVDVEEICTIADAAGANTILKRPDLDDRSIVCAAQ